MKRIHGMLLTLAILGAVGVAFAAVTCETVKMNDQTCGAQMWQCNQCGAVGCDDLSRECPALLQDLHAAERQCVYCGSNDWAPLEAPVPEAPDPAELNGFHGVENSPQSFP